MLFLDYLAGLNVNRSGLKQLGSEREAVTGRGGAAGGPALPLWPPAPPARGCPLPGRPPRGLSLEDSSRARAPPEGHSPTCAGESRTRLLAAWTPCPQGHALCNIHTPGHIRIPGSMLTPVPTCTCNTPCPHAQTPCNIQTPGQHTYTRQHTHTHTCTYV